MIIRVRFKNTETKEFVSKWMLYTVPSDYSFYRMFNEIHAGTLKPNVDLSWSDAESCTFHVAVINKDIPVSDDLHEASECITLGDVYEKNRKVFLQIELRPFKLHDFSDDDDHVSTATSSSFESAATCSSKISTENFPPRPSIVDVLMRKLNNFPPLKDVTRMTSDVEQYNRFVKYIIESKFGVVGGDLCDYLKLVETFCSFL